VVNVKKTREIGGSPLWQVLRLTQQNSGNTTPDKMRPLQQ
jgi:hypothetical protein